MPFCPDCGVEFVAGVPRCSDCGAALDTRLALSLDEPDERLMDIFVTPDPAEAEVVQALLQASGIPSSQHSGVPQSILPQNSHTLEPIRIHVREDDAEVARALIESRGEPGDVE